MVKVHSINPRKQAPLVTWVAVTDPDGHRRMEMRWHVAEDKASERDPRHAA